jgi:transposase InsO family protein
MPPTGAVPAPEGRAGPGRARDVIHHSHHTSLAFGRRCREAGVRPSTGSIGDAWDNAMCKDFFALFEFELLARRRFTPRRGAHGYLQLCRSLIQLARLHPAGLPIAHDLREGGAGRHRRPVISQAAHCPQEPVKPNMRPRYEDLSAHTAIIDSQTAKATQ